MRGGEGERAGARIGERERAERDILRGQGREKENAGGRMRIREKK